MSAARDLTAIKQMLHDALASAALELTYDLSDPTSKTLCFEGDNYFDFNKLAANVHADAIAPLEARIAELETKLTADCGRWSDCTVYHTLGEAMGEVPHAAQTAFWEWSGDMKHAFANEVHDRFRVLYEMDTEEDVSRLRAQA